MGKTKVRQVGGANGLILPKKIMDQAELELGTELDITVDEMGNIVIRKSSDRYEALNMIERVESILISGDSKGDVILKNIVTNMCRFVISHMESQSVSLDDVFTAYKKNDADMMLYALTGGKDLKHILEISIDE